MPFPVTVGEVTISTPRELGYWLLKDAHSPGSLVEGEDPRQWFLAVAPALSDDELCGILRALLDRPTALGVGLGVHLVGALRPKGMGRWVIRALQHGDLGALMSSDPFSEKTVEGALAILAAQWLPLEQDAEREAILQALRTSGAVLEEATLLARSGSAREILLFGPGLLETGIPEVRVALEAGLSREPEGVALQQILEPSDA